MASEPGRRLNLTKLLLFRALKQALDFFFPAPVRRVLLVIGQFSLLPLRPLSSVVFKRSQSREEKLFLSHFFPFGVEERKKKCRSEEKERGRGGRAEDILLHHFKSLSAELLYKDIQVTRQTLSVSLSLRRSPCSSWQSNF